MPEVPTIDLLYLILEFYDRPQRGVADVRGVPHAFHSLCDDDEGEFSDIYMLSPLSNDTFDLCLQTWAIERRWYNDGRGKGESRISGIPALPNETKQYQEVVAAIENDIRFDPSTAIYATESSFHESVQFYAVPLRTVEWNIASRPIGNIFYRDNYWRIKR